MKKKRSKVGLSIWCATILHLFLISICASSSLQAENESASIDNQQLSIKYIKKANQALTLYHWDQAYEAAKEAVEKAKKELDHRLLAKSYLCLARAFLSLPKQKAKNHLMPKEIEEYMNKAIKIASHLRDAALATEIYMGISRQCLLQKLYKEALKYAIKGQRSSELKLDQSNTKHLWVIPYLTLGEAYQANKQNEKAEKIAQLIQKRTLCLPLFSSSEYMRLTDFFIQQNLFLPIEKILIIALKKHKSRNKDTKSIKKALTWVGFNRHFRQKEASPNDLNAFDLDASIYTDPWRKGRFYLILAMNRIAANRKEESKQYIIEASNLLASTSMPPLYKTYIDKKLQELFLLLTPTEKNSFLTCSYWKIFGMGLALCTMAYMVTHKIG